MSYPGYSSIFTIIIIIIMVLLATSLQRCSSFTNKDYEMGDGF